MGDRWRIAAWSVAAAAASLALTAWGIPAAILVGMGVGALTRGGIQALATALAGDLVTPAQRGRAIGIMHTAGDVGSAAGPLIAYAVLPQIGLGGIYGIGAGLFLLEWALIAWYHRRHQVS
jgi:MFS family permease